MNDSERLRRAFERAKRVLEKRNIRDVTPKVRAIVGDEIPDGEKKAQTAWDKLGKGVWPDPDEMAALEIVIRLLRPAPLSHSGDLDDLPEDPDHPVFPAEVKDQWSAFKSKVKPLLYSIGRVEMAQNGEHIGTGFLVDDGLLATNRHVLDELTMGTGLLAKDRARVSFQAEDRSDGALVDPRHTVRIEGVVGFHPTLDIALLSVPKLGRPAVHIEAASLKEGDRVVVVGYPALDSLRNPLFIGAVFGNKNTLGLKRAALGEALDGCETPFLYHDCSTLGGNSGSPVFSLLNGSVIGIHFGGFFRYRNEAHDGVSLSRSVSKIKQP